MIISVKNIKLYFILGFKNTYIEYTLVELNKIIESK